MLIGLDKLLREKRRYQGDLSAPVNDALLAVNLNTVKLVTLQGKKKQTARETHLLPPAAHLREAVLREYRSFAVEDLIVDSELLESARNAGYATKVIFISTEDPTSTSAAS